MKIRKPYAARGRVYTSFFDEDGNKMESLTQQHLKNSCDINHIINQYDRTGLITHVNQSVAQYGDFTQVNEYQESLNLVISAQNSFDELPAQVRKRFGNNPGEFFEFATNPKNYDELVKLGLANPRSAENVEENQADKKSEAEE